MAELLFYLLAAGTVAAGVGVIASRNPLFSVLSLLGAFFCLASIYLLAGFPFLAATQLLVYAGAIMVLFLFVIMLLNLGDEAQYVERPAGLGKRRATVAGASAGILLLVVVFSVSFGSARASSDQAAVAPDWPEGSIDDLHAIAELLFTRYLLPFEAASLLLLATMVAVILLAKRQRAAGGSGAGWPWKEGSEQR